MKLRRLTFIAIPLLCCLAWLDPYRDAISDGNEEYRSKKYRAAKRCYEKAERHAPSADEKKKCAFNTGDAEYMLQAYDNALDEFRKALETDDRDVQKKALFNMGNTYLRMGNTKEAIRAYIEALKIDPGYERAKKNLERLLSQKKPPEQNNNDSRQKNSDSRSDGRKNTQSGANDSQNQKEAQKRGQDSRHSRQGGGSMSRDQIMNMLKGLEQGHVRRQKGSGDEKRMREKSW